MSFSKTMFAIGLASIALMIGLSLNPTGDVGVMLTLNTIRLSLIWYVAAIALLLINRRRQIPFTLTRWCWTWGAITFLIHVGVAFHFYHRWSHMMAFESVREASGSGEGIYVSYLFTLIWMADVIWWWVSPTKYLSRTRMISATLHVFMLFIIFNGVVVFESGPIRWIGVLVFIALGMMAWQTRKPSTSAITMHS